MQKSLFSALLFLILHISIQAQSQNFFTLDIVSFLSPRYSIIGQQTIDLKGSYFKVNPSFGQQFMLKKRFPISDKFAYSIGAGLGYSHTHFEYKSTHAFNGLAQHDYIDTAKKILSVADFRSAIAEIGYRLQLGKRTFLFNDMGIKITYVKSLTPIDFSHTYISDNTYEYKYLLYSDIRTVNDKSSILLSFEWSPYVVYRFKHSDFGIKAGTSLSFSPLNLLEGEVFLEGTEDVFTADIEGHLSFVGVSVGVLYFPKRK